MGRTKKGFKVSSGEARYGRHYEMMGITLNVLDIKISSKDTDGDLAVFEQNGFMDITTNDYRSCKDLCRPQHEGCWSGITC